MSPADRRSFRTEAEADRAELEAVIDAEAVLATLDYERQRLHRELSEARARHERAEPHWRAGFSQADATWIADA